MWTWNLEHGWNSHQSGEQTTRGRTILTEYMLYVVADKLHFFIAGNSKQIGRVRLYRPGQLLIAANQTTDDDEDLTIYHLIWRISDCWSSRGSGWWQWGVVGWSQTRFCEWWVVQAGAAATFFCRTYFCTWSIPPLEPQSCFGEKLLEILSPLSPKGDCGSKGVKSIPNVHERSLVELGWFWWCVCSSH